MDWAVLQRRFLKQLSESFIILQTYSDFSSLDLELKTLIVRERLWRLARKQKSSELSHANKGKTGKREEKVIVDLELLRWMLMSWFHSLVFRLIC